MEPISSVVAMLGDCAGAVGQELLLATAEPQKKNPNSFKITVSETLFFNLNILFIVLPVDV